MSAGRLEPRTVLWTALPASSLTCQQPLCTLCRRHSPCAAICASHGGLLPMLKVHAHAATGLLAPRPISSSG